jgi:uncharacterized membrane protein YeaQ/YmgE (transglycosylase-associated protein family)
MIAFNPSSEVGWKANARKEDCGMNFILWIILGIVAGWLAGVVTRTNRNIWGDLVLGLIGAFVAGLVVKGSVGGNAGFWSSLVAATIAAIILVWLKNLVMGRRA